MEIGEGLVGGGRVGRSRGTFSLRTSWMRDASLEMLLMISEVVASCESKKPTSCRRMACRYRCRIRSTCRSLVRLQQYPSAARLKCNKLTRNSQKV